MNVYDFDKTIYRHDSNTDFYLYALKKHPSLVRYWPRQLFALTVMGLHVWPLHRAKELFMSYVRGIDDLEGLIREFWQTHIDLVNAYYPALHRADDVVISASPMPIVQEGCRLLGIHEVLATEMDPETGKFLTPNCKGAEKVTAFHNRYGNVTVDAFYSDSLTDTPMAEIATEAFFIRKGVPEPWPWKGKE